MIQSALKMALNLSLKGPDGIKNPFMVGSKYTEDIAAENKYIRFAK